MIFRSPYPDVDIPDTPITPFVLQHADALAEKPALVEGTSGRTLTYGEVATGVRSAAGGLSVTAHSSMSSVAGVSGATERAVVGSLERRSASQNR